MPKNEERLPRALLGTACIVIIAWGIKAASHILLLVFIALFLAYAIVPFPRWLIKRHKVRTHTALGMTVALVIACYLFFSSLLFMTGIRMMARLPSYEVHFTELYTRIVGFLNSHGTHFASLPSAGFLSADKVAEFAIKILPTAVGVFSDRLLLWLLCLLFLIEIVELEESKRGPLARGLLHYGSDVQRYIGIQAKTGAITTLANFALLVALGVDFPILWCSLYFFLQFIPSLGFIIALIPPTLLALMVLGWKKAFLVAGGLLLTQLLSDYILQPMFMKKGLHLSLFEIMMSLIIWGSLLGPWGGILAVPLTLTLRKFILESSIESVPVHPV